MKTIQIALGARVDHLAAGVALLNAMPYSDGFAYYESGTRAWYAVSVSDVAELGRRLTADPRAYSLWCAETQARNLTEDGLAGSDAGGLETGGGDGDGNGGGGDGDGDGGGFGYGTVFGFGDGTGYGDGSGFGYGSGRGDGGGDGDGGGYGDGGGDGDGGGSGRGDGRGDGGGVGGGVGNGYGDGGS
jgi:hypothetical protein